MNHKEKCNIGSVKNYEKDNKSYSLQVLGTIGGWKIYHCMNLNVKKTADLGTIQILSSSKGSFN